MTQGFVWGKQNKKRNYGRNWHQNISEEKNKNKIWKNTAQIYLKKTNKKTTNTWQNKVKTNPTIFLKTKKQKKKRWTEKFWSRHSKQFYQRWKFFWSEYSTDDADDSEDDSVIAFR